MSEGLELQSRSPLISIVMPTFNRLDFLYPTIESILAQTYSNWELVIVDDGSEQEMIQYLKSLSASDKRIRFFQRQGAKKGACVCRNQGLSQSNGEYIIFMDSDDLLINTCLERRVYLLNRFPEFELYGFYIAAFQSNPESPKYMWNILTDRDIADRLLLNDTLFQSMTLMWSRSAILKINGWNESLHYRQDWEIQTRAVILGLKLLFVPYIDTLYRTFSQNQISQLVTKNTDINIYSGLAEAFKILFTSLKRSNNYTEERRQLLLGTFVRITVSDYPVLFYKPAMSFLFFGLKNGFMTLKEYFIILTYFLLYFNQIRGRLIKKIRTLLPPYSMTGIMPKTRNVMPVLSEYFDFNDALTKRVTYNL